LPGCPPFAQGSWQRIDSWGRQPRRPSLRHRVSIDRAGIYFFRYQLGALLTDQITAMRGGELAVVVDQEAAGAAELVGAHRSPCDGEFLVEEFRCGQLERVAAIIDVRVRDGRPRVLAAGLQPSGFSSATSIPPLRGAS